MVAPTLLSTEEYLSSSFEYDKEYVEGELVERSMPTFQHGWLQTALSAFLFQRRTDWGIETVSDTRIRIAKAVFRVADICVVDATSPVSSIIRVPPLCVIEILSPDDRLANIRVKAREYLTFGCRHVWTVDPISGECYEHHEHNMSPVQDGVLRVRNTEIVIPIHEILAPIGKGA